MGRQVGCLLDASDATAETLGSLRRRFGATALFVRGAMAIQGARSKLPVAAQDGAAPGITLSDDDSALRTALDAARAENLDAYLVIANPFVGSAAWTDLLAEDNGGRRAERVDADAPVLCPNRPKLLKWIAFAAVEAARTYKPAGLLLDDFSVGSPERFDSLFMCWCDLCRARAEELGYDADSIRIGLQGARTKTQEPSARVPSRSALGLTQFVEGIGSDVGILNWLNFRADCVSACMFDVRQAVASLDARLRVGLLAKGPSVAMLAGQRRVDALRDTTIADFYVPVVTGAASGIPGTIAALAQHVRIALRQGAESDALALSAQILGCCDLPLPATAAELVAAQDPDLWTAVAERELELTRAVASPVPQWPAIDARGMHTGAPERLIEQVLKAGFDDFALIGVPR